MTDPQQRLTYAEVRDAGLDDWRPVLGTLRSRFLTGDFATGLALVGRIGAAAEEADHHPDVTLTYPEVRVALSSHDVEGLTSRDVDLARVISGFADEAGIESDPEGLTALELGLDTDDPRGLSPFYAALLGVEDGEDEVSDDTGQVPTLWFQTPDPDDADGALPVLDAPQRWHLDVWVAEDVAEDRVRAALDAGGRLVSDVAAPTYWVLEDPEGNRSCVCTSAGRS